MPATLDASPTRPAAERAQAPPIRSLGSCALQRCGPRPCSCSAQERERHAQRGAGGGGLHRAARSPWLPGDEPDWDLVRRPLGEPGRPLEAAAADRLGARLGHDFSAVRVHDDATAAASARAVDALAFTVGQHLVFDRGRYAPGTGDGERLLAHELTHVVQQAGQPIPAGPLPIVAPDAPSEREAGAGSIDGSATIGHAPGVFLGRQNDAGIASTPSSGSLADMVSQALDQPDPVAGFRADYPTAFSLISGLPISDLFPLFEELDRRGFLDGLIGNARQSNDLDVDRLVASMLVVKLTVPNADLSESAVWRVAGAMERVSNESATELINQLVDRRVRDTSQRRRLLEDISSLLETASQSTPIPEGVLAGATAEVEPGPWNPPGRQWPGFYIGTQAHIGIATSYNAAHAGDLTFTNFIPMSRILLEWSRLGVGANSAALNKEELGVMPDIANLSRRHLYEIKPATAQARAASEAAWYVALFVRAGVPMALGPIGEVGTSGVIPAPAGVYVFSTPFPGVITYQYRPGGLYRVKVRERAPAGERSTEPRFRFEIRPLRPHEVAAITTGVLILLIVAAIVLSPVGA